jgi:hypothetical protein
MFWWIFRLSCELRALPLSLREVDRFANCGFLKRYK